MDKEKAREIKNRFIAKQRSLGLCLECNNPAKGKARCEACLLRRRNKQAENRAKAASENQCRECFKVPAFGSGLRCKKCFAKRLSRRYFVTSTHWQALLDKFEAQQGLCAYSGRKLALSEDTELDHILPLSRGGENTVENVQWVLAVVNQMKRSLTEEEFFSLVRDICEYRT